MHSEDPALQGPIAPQLDPTDPQQNELRVAQVAIASLWGTLHGLGLVASAETA